MKNDNNLGKFSLNHNQTSMCYPMFTFDLRHYISTFKLKIPNSGLNFFKGSACNQHGIFDDDAKTFKYDEHFKVYADFK